MGFRSQAGILNWLAVFERLLAKTQDGAGAFSYQIIFLPFISYAFVPTDIIPKAVRVFAENQPVTPIVEAIRNLLANHPVGDNIWVALAWCIAITVIAYFFAMRIYKRL